MASDKRFLDDLARMASGAASLASTVRRQVQSDIKERTKSYTSGLSGDKELERLQASVTKYRLEQEQMKKRLEALETLVGAGKSKSKTTASKKKPLKPSKRK